jgi:hypothetical protein
MEKPNKEEILEFAKVYYQKNKSTIAAGSLTQNLKEDEVRAAVDGLTKDVALSSDSIYDFVFWLFYHENNPFVMAKVKMITTLTMVVHFLFIFYYLKTLY